MDGSQTRESLGRWEEMNGTQWVQTTDVRHSAEKFCGDRAIEEFCFCFEIGEIQV